MFTDKLNRVDANSAEILFIQHKFQALYMSIELTLGSPQVALDIPLFSADYWVMMILFMYSVYCICCANIKLPSTVYHGASSLHNAALLHYLITIV